MKREFGSNNYALLANAQDHWVGFTCRKMKSFLSKYGDDFNLIIYWEQPTFGYYSIPYNLLKDILTKENSEKGQGTRWVFTIRENRIIHLNGTSINIDISDFYRTSLDKDKFAKTNECTSSPEGEKKLRQHYTLERDTSFVRKIKQIYYSENPNMPCQICGFSFTERYGDLGVGFIEAHHKVPLVELTETKKHELKDFVFVCANCHRMLHRNIPVVLSEDLKLILKS